VRYATANILILWENYEFAIHRIHQFKKLPVQGTEQGY